MKKYIKIERNHCRCHPDTCSCADYVLTYKGDKIAFTSNKKKLEMFISDIKAMEK